MKAEEMLRRAFVGVRVNDDYSEAELAISDGTRLCFCHRVGERWAKAVGPEGSESAVGLATEILACIARFRLNGKHLDLLFNDGSRWELPFARAK